MRSWLEQKLQAAWYGASKPSLLLRALSQIYGRLSAWNLSRQGDRAQSIGAPVVVVGNIVAGGSGKSPLVIWLLEQMAERGWNPGVVMRGYRANPGVSPQLVNVDSELASIGDEALMIWQRCQRPVAVHPDRVAAARVLVAQGIDLIVSDDGLQHRRLQRDIEIAVIDGSRGIGNGYLLPAGPLREPAERLAEVDFVVQNGNAESALSSQRPTITMQFLGSTLRRVDQPSQSMSLSQLEQTGPIDALAGIGNPQRFFAQLLSSGLEIVEHVFADHHHYNASELEKFSGKVVLMTEKDAVKCRQLAAGQSWWYLPVRAELPSEFADEIHARLTSA